MHQPGDLRRSERGQVIVEQAIILPMMVFLILGIVQLSMVQHARIATEYAAYNAARSGIVYNGDVDKMERAAFFSVLPTLGRSDNWGDLFETVFKKALLAQFGADLADMLGFDILGDMKMVQVAIVPHPDPSVGDRIDVIEQQGHLNQQQIDFDDFRTLPSTANQLTVQVKYFYKMRIPFANFMLHYMWMATRADAMAAYGTMAFLNPERTILGQRTGISSHDEILVRAIGASGDDDDLRISLQYRLAGEYRIPINTFYTMRMQSNLYRSNLGN